MCQSRVGLCYIEWEMCLTPEAPKRSVLVGHVVERTPQAELTEIRRVLRALVSISAFPRLWKDQSEEAIVQRFASALVKVLDADFAYVSMASHRRVLEFACGPLGRVSAASILEIRTSVNGSSFMCPRRIKSAVSGEPATFLSMPLGTGGGGLFAVAVNRPTYPTEFDELILQVAANEATAALERAEGLAVQRHLATLVSHSSNFIGVADLQGVPQFVNPAGLRLVGMASMQEARELHVVDFLDFRDRDRARYEVWPETLSKGRWSGELSCLNAETGVGVPLLVECFRIDAPTGEPVAVGTISVDIRKWNRAEGTSDDDPSVLAKTCQVMLAVARVESLSKRERQVLHALVAGYSHKVIAHELGISVRTIEVHRARMMRRMGVRTLAEAIRLAVISGAE